MSFTPAQIEALKAPLAASAVKRKPGKSGGDYVDGHHVISMANEIFGHDGWSFTSQVDFVTAYPRTTQKGAELQVVGYRANVRVTINGVTRSGQGFGISEVPSLAEAHNNACKTAETDALKRALHTLGNVFGLALYDKDRTDVIDDSPEAVAQREREEAQAKARQGQLSGALESLLGKIAEAATLQALAEAYQTTFKRELIALRNEAPTLYAQAEAAKDARKAELSAPRPMQPVQEAAE